MTPVAVAEHHLVMRRPRRPPHGPGAAVELLQAPDEEAGEAEQPHTEPEKRAEPDVAHPVASATRLAIHRRRRRLLRGEERREEKRESALQPHLPENLNGAGAQGAGVRVTSAYIAVCVCVCVSLLVLTSKPNDVMQVYKGCGLGQPAAVFNTLSSDDETTCHGTLENHTYTKKEKSNCHFHDV